MYIHNRGVCPMEVGKIVRKAVLKFADAIGGAHERMSHDDLFEACSNTTPSEIGMQTLLLYLSIFDMQYS